MSLRFIFFLVFIVIFSFFIGGNLENRCDLSLIFYKFKEISVILPILTSFVLGALTTFVFNLFSKKKKPKIKKDDKDKSKVETKINKFGNDEKIANTENQNPKEVNSQKSKKVKAKKK